MLKVGKFEFYSSPEEFLNGEVRTKSDLIEQLYSRIGELGEKAGTDMKSPAAFYGILKSSMEEFIEKVKKAPMIEELPDGWIYQHRIGCDMIQVFMSHVIMVDTRELKEVFEPGDAPFLCFTDAAYQMVNHQLEALSVEEFAKVYDVKSGTVRQWIRRVKIRSAHKTGNEWKIPILTTLPDRGYTPATYTWGYETIEWPEEFRGLHLDMCHKAHIEREKGDKESYRVYFSVDFPERSGAEFSTLMNTASRERFELFLISNPNIRYDFEY